MIVRSIVCNYSILYSVQGTLWRIACIGHRGKGRAPKPFEEVGVLKGNPKGSC